MNLVGEESILMCFSVCCGIKGSLCLLSQTQRYSTGKGSHVNPHTTKPPASSPHLDTPHRRLKVIICLTLNCPPCSIKAESNLALEMTASSLL